MFVNGEYRVIFGEIFDRKTKTWNWIETNPSEIVEKIRKAS